MTCLRSIAPALSVGLVTTMVVTTACKDDGISQEDAAEAIARAICDRYFACDCTEYNDVFSSHEQCLADQEAEAQQGLDEGNAAGLTYDGDCVAAWVTLSNQLGCKSGSELTVGEYVRVLETLGCKWFYGDQQGGQPCESLTEAPGDDCVQGYLCNDQGVCEAIDEVPGPGEACDMQFSTVCSNDALCLDADGDGTAQCERLPTTGQTCLGMLDLCAEGFVCDQGSKTCGPAPTAGQPCATTPIAINQCAPNLVCEVGTCSARPQGGEPCLANQCSDGFVCEGGTCVDEPAIACGVNVATFGA